MVKTSIFYKDLQAYLSRLVSTIELKVSFGMRRGSRKMSAGYRDNIKRGLGAEGRPMSPVKESTMNMPIRVTTDKRIRRSVNPSVNALSATGATAASIKDKRVNKTEYIIESTSERGNKILSSNAYPGKGQGIAKGRKPVRDPLQVTDVQMQIIEEEILTQLDKALK